MNHPHVAYRAPARGGAFPPIAATWRRVLTAAVVLSGLGFLIAVGLWTAAIASSPDRPDETLIGAGGLVIIGTILLMYFQAFAGMAWVHAAWKWLPGDQRYAKSWRSWISPEQAALMLLIPYFQYYWMFVINLGLCDAFDRLRVRFPTREAAPKNLALVASIMQLILPIPVAGICWVIYSSKIEAMSREMSAGAAGRGNDLF